MYLTSKNMEENKSEMKYFVLFNLKEHYFYFMHLLNKIATKPIIWKFL